MEVILQALALGALYALTGLCFSITFAGAGVFNFAQAQFVMLGTFASYAAVNQLGLPLAAAIVFSLVIGGFIGLLEEVIAISPLPPHARFQRFVTTLGVFVTLEAGAEAIWGPEPLAIRMPSLSVPVSIAGGTLTRSDIALILFVIVAGICASTYKRRSIYGVASRAALENRVGAALRGVNTRGLSVASFALAGAVAGAAGVLVGVRTYATFNLGEILTVYGFAALAIAGFGNSMGVVLSGFLVGLIQAESTRWLGTYSADPCILLLLLGVLVLRPAGLSRVGPGRAV